MKKIILSTIVIVGCIVYAYYFRVKGITQIAIPNEPKKSKTVFITPSIYLIHPTKLQQSPTIIQANSQYKDGTYVGSIADAVYGNIQIKVIITNGKINNVLFLQYPNDQASSTSINQFADPQLAQEAIQSQSANVAIVSGATQSSQAFIQSLQSALAKAKS